MSASFDRYVSFKHCDWEGRSERVMQRLQRHVDAAENPFWAYFAQKRIELRDKQGLDDLRILHNYLPTLRESCWKTTAISKPSRCWRIWKPT